MSQKLTTPPTVIVLAAGKGERFRASGATQDKLQSLLCGQTVREHVLSAVRASGMPYHVVERAHTSHLENPGMGDSIACGVAATPNAHGWLILPADLPLIRVQTLSAVATALQKHAVVVPYFEQQNGHPVGFARPCQEAMLQLTGDQGARSVMAQHTVYRLNVDDEGCVLDVDTVSALKLVEIRMQKLDIN